MINEILESLNALKKDSGLTVLIRNVTDISLGSIDVYSRKICVNIENCIAMADRYNSTPLNLAKAVLCHELGHLVHSDRVGEDKYFNFSDLTRECNADRLGKTFVELDFIEVYMDINRQNIEHYRKLVA